MQQIAKALRISAEALYVQAGILEEREGSAAVAEAIMSDELITERQKHVLLEIYDSFHKGNEARTVSTAARALAAQEGVDVQVSEQSEPVVTLTEAPGTEDAAAGDSVRNDGVTKSTVMSDAVTNDSVQKAG